jgi:hypothetical protein
VDTPELPGGDVALLGQSEERPPLLLGECHELSPGHHARPFLREGTTGRTPDQNRCGGPLEIVWHILAIDAGEHEPYLFFLV